MQMASRYRPERALLWYFVEVFGSQALPLIIFTVIARFLAPQEYGAYGIGLLVVTTAAVVLYQGIGDMLIRHDDPDEEMVATAFWLSAGLGLAVFLLVQGVASFSGQLFGAPRAEALIRSLSPMILARALTNVPSSLLRREMRIEVLALRTALGYLLGGAIGIVMAAFGAGVWALVAVQLISAGIAVVVTWTAADWRPRLLFSRRRAREISGFSGHVMAASVAVFLTSKADGFVVSAMFEARTIGLYLFCLRLMDAVTSLSLTPVRNLLLPVLSRLGGASASANSFIGTLNLSQFIWSIILITFALAAPLATPIIFGARWADAAPLIMLLALPASLSPFAQLTGQALIASGRPNTYSAAAALHLLLISVGAYAGARVSLTWCILGLFIANLVMLPVYVTALREVLDLPKLARLAPSFAMPALLDLTLLLVRHQFTGRSMLGALALSTVTWSAFVAVSCLAFPGMVHEGVRRLRSTLLVRGG